MEFYTYLIRNPSTNEYYVGKGSRLRWKGSMKEQGCSELRVLYHCDDEGEAFRLEDKVWVEMMKRGFTLRNKTRPGRYGQWDQRSGWRHTEQARRLISKGNRTTKRVKSFKLAYGDKIQTVAEWSEELGLSLFIIYSRLKKKWPIERILAPRSWRLIKFSGRMGTVGEWAEWTGLSEAVIRGRIKRGWPIERVLTMSAYRGRRFNKGRHKLVGKALQEVQRV